MLSKKVVWLTLVGLMVLTFWGGVSGEVNASGYTIEDAFEDNFEQDTVGEAPSGWYLRNPAKATLIVQQEGGNNFARILVPQGMTTTDSASNIPFAVRVLEQPVPLSESYSTVIEAKVRTNGTTFRKMFKPNYPTDSEHQYYNEFWNNAYTLWFMHSSPASFATLTGSSGTGNPPAPNTPNVFSYQTNKWYRVKAVLRTADSMWDFYVYNDADELEFERLNLSTNIWYMNNASAIENLTFFFRNAVTLSADETFDIDDLKVYKKIKNITATLSQSTFNTFASSINVKFTGEMNGDTLNQNTVKLYTKQGEFIPATGIYNESQNVYTITPGSLLGIGNYIVTLDTDVINVVSFETEELSFDVMKLEALNFDNFENDIIGEAPSGWYSRNPAKATVTVQEEYGNKFARVTVPQGTITTDSAGNTPIIVRVLEEPVSLSDGQYTVIEAKIRTNNTNFRKMFKPNYPTDSEHQYYNEFWNNAYTLFNIHSSPASIGVLSGDYGTGNPSQPNLPSVFEYQTNEWYRIKAVLRTSEKMWDFYVYSDSGSFVETGLSTDIWYMNDASAIENLTFFFRNALTLSAAETFDFDDVMVYNIQSKVYYFNENNEEITTLQTGGINTKIQYYNTTGTSMDMYLVNAKYEDNGGVLNLIDIRIETINVLKDDFLAIALETLTINETENYFVKSFLWDKSNITPFINEGILGNH